MDNINDFQNSTYAMMQRENKKDEKVQKKKKKTSSKTKELYFDDHEDQQPAKLPQVNSSEMNPNKNYKLQQKQRERVPKLPTGTITRNFFDIQSQEDYQQSHSPTKLLQAKQVAHPKQSQRRYRNKIKLQPLKNADPKRVQIPENNSKQEEDTRKNEQKNDEDKKIQIKNPEKVKKIQKRTTNNYKLNFQLSSSDHQEEIERKNNKQKVQKNRQQKKQSEHEEEQIQNQQIQSESHPQPEQQLNQEERTSPLPLRSAIKIAGCKQYIIRRDKQWLNKIWPQFNLHIMTNNSFFLSAKMTGNNASTTFMISENQADFTQNGAFYRGKAKSNFIGNIINIYSKGYNPTDFKNNKGKIRDLLATVEYQTNFFGSTRPRNFRVFMLKPGFNYYEDLEGPEKGEDQLSLNQLYDNPLNKQKILVMTNRKPEWNEKIKGFMLNFGGKVKKPSIKNFILEDEANPETARLLFGKIDENQFRLDIGESISPIVGFGIALSTFGSKIGCQ